MGRCLRVAATAVLLNLHPSRPANDEEPCSRRLFVQLLALNIRSCYNLIGSDVNYCFLVEIKSRYSLLPSSSQPTLFLARSQLAPSTWKLTI
ncbi:hypothetical protein KSP40_PGU007196 [Platanthera guangdongensis]|uniref:Secreted protein n=1 Tax=Platanthera guangdongensis TaxID=2320717 RepID=A0ABR2MCS4_9ASPA